MATLGQHLVSARAEIVALTAAVQALTAELQAIRGELQTLNGKTPALVGGKVPTLATANGTMPITTDQLPATLSAGKLKVTGLL